MPKDPWNGTDKTFLECNMPNGYDFTFGPRKWASSAKVGLHEVLPDYHYDYDDEWNEWEAIEISYQCSQATSTHDDHSRTAVFEINSTPNTCENAFIYS